MIDGDYPAVRKLLTAQTDVTAVLAVQPLIEAARRVSLVAQRNTPVQITFSEGQASLNAGTGDEPQASDIIEASFEGEEIAVGFNHGYLLDGLSVMTSPFVRFSMTHPNKPVLFRGQESLDGPVVPDYQYLLVPIRFAT